MSRRGEKKRSPILGLFLLLLMLIVIGFVVAMGWWMNSNKPVDKDDLTGIEVIVPDGYGASGIAALLEKAGLIRNQLAFKIAVKLDGLDGKLQAGTYVLNKAQTPSELAQSMLHGRDEEIVVTIPEGKRREEVAKILKDAFTDYGAAFSISEFMQLTANQEGYLFPDTYNFSRTSSVRDIVEKMRATFDKKVTYQMKLDANDVGLTFEEVMILASLVEREAKFEVDRPMIARVMLNRLDLGMPLQIDATVQYAVGEARCKAKLGYDCDWWPVLSSTEYDSLYNTYQYPGLPPAPIANPGLDVIEAVLYNDDHDYLYYLSEDSGKTYYSETLEEHEVKIDQYLR